MCTFIKNVLVFLTIWDISVYAKIVYNTLPPPTTENLTDYQRTVKSLVCFIKPQRGPCRANIQMYFYRPSAKKCQTFEWGGCQGNGNRFHTEEECINACISQPGEPRVRPPLCFLAFDYGFCFGKEQRYFYDSMWKTCKLTIYSGCGGNGNNFHFLSDCENQCLFNNGKPAIYTITPRQFPTTTRKKKKKRS